jgi:hypothetical protein
MKALVLFAALLCCSSLATAIPFKKCVKIDPAGGQVPGGENIDCGKGPPSPLIGGPLDSGLVKCADAELSIPAGYVIQSMNVTFNPGGWNAVTRGPDREQQRDGSTLITASGKNWSHNRAPQMCIHAEASPGGGMQKPTMGPVPSSTPGRTR